MPRSPALAQRLRAWRLAPFVKGAGSCVPGLAALAARRSGGTDDAAYCYSVWLRHLVMAFQNGLTKLPETIAELGPGDSLGIGLSALLSGTSRYYAFDQVASANLTRNLGVWGDLIRAFATREEIPHGGPRFAGIKPLLPSYAFPHEILTPALLEQSLDPSRLEALRAQLAGESVPTDAEPQVRYMAPWHERQILLPQSVDFVISQAVLEHVDRLTEAYAAMALWVKPGGFMSHQIDFRCHGTARQWNGHWTYPDWAWRIIRGRRPYLINREPLSVHLAAITAAGFEIVNVVRHLDPGGLTRESLAPRFRGLSDSDLTTSGALVQAIRRT